MNFVEINLWFAVFFYAAAGVLSIFQFYYSSLKTPSTFLALIAFVLHIILLVYLFVTDSLILEDFSNWLYVISYLVAFVRLSFRFKDRIGWSHAIFPFIATALLVGLLISKYPTIIVDSLGSQVILLMHILLLLVGYTFSFLACISCILFWKQERQIKFHAFKLISNHLPPLGKLDRSIKLFFKWGLFLQTGGILFGIVLADLLKTSTYYGRIGVAVVTWGFFTILVLYQSLQNKRPFLNVILSLLGLFMIVISLYLELIYLSQ